MGIHGNTWEYMGIHSKYQVNTGEYMGTHSEYIGTHSDSVNRWGYTGNTMRYTETQDVKTIPTKQAMTSP